MPDPIDLDELERVLAEHDALIAHAGLTDAEAGRVRRARLALVRACPALIAEVRALRVALDEACDLAKLMADTPYHDIADARRVTKRCVELRAIAEGRR